MTVPGIRIEKGEATDEDLAALTVLLLSRLARPTPDTEPGTPGVNSWRPRAFRAPNSWQG